MNIFGPVARVYTCTAFHTQWTMWGAIVLGVAAAGACNYTPGGTYPSILDEYEYVVRAAEHLTAASSPESSTAASSPESNTRRARRALSATPTQHFPFDTVTINGSISRRDRTIVYRAIQYASVLHAIPEGESPIDLVFIVGTASPTGTTIIGSWDGVVIRLHTLSIDNENLLFIVTLHEIYHILHFGTAAFESLTTPENVYTGPNTSACVANHTVRTDNLGTSRPLLSPRTHRAASSRTVIQRPPACSGPLARQHRALLEQLHGTHHPRRRECRGRQMHRHRRRRRPDIVVAHGVQHTGAMPHKLHVHRGNIAPRGVVHPHLERRRVHHPPQPRRPPVSRPHRLCLWRLCVHQHPHPVRPQTPPVPRRKITKRHRMNVHVLLLAAS